MGFVFYDTETTGTDTYFDQILQFAAIKTDHELRELDRFEIRSRLLSYVVPSPGAMLVTGVGPSQFTNPELPSHYQMVRAIKAKLDEWTPSVFIGHNSLSFDEHLLRQAFYKTLHAPYLTNTNSNCRSDSLRMFQSLHLYAPGIVTVPISHNHKPTFKLDLLAPANGFNHSSAHDAMGDVEATVYLCRMLADRADTFWSNFVRFAQKSAVLDFVQEDDFYCFTEIFYGKTYSWIVCRIGENPDNATEQLVFNLAIDPGELVLLDHEGLTARLLERPKPVRSLRANASPALLAYEDTPSHLRTAMPSEHVLRDRSAQIRGDEQFAQRLTVAFLSTRPEHTASIHVEEQIYDSFTSAADQSLMDHFHTLDWIDRPSVLDSLTDKRAEKLAKRLLYEEAPSALLSAVRGKLDVAIARRLMGEDGPVPWLTLPKALTDTNDMLAVASGEDAKLLAELQNYLVDRSDEASAKIT